MTNKRTEHTTEDGTTFKVGDNIVEVDRVGSPLIGTIGTVVGFTKYLMKVVELNGMASSYKLSTNYSATDIGDVRPLTDNYQYILKAGANERGHYGAIHKGTVRLLESANSLMYNRSSVGGTRAPDPVEAYKLLKQAQAKLNEAITRIEVESGEVLDY